MKIAVFNCDKYWDVSRAWLELYRRFWPEQPYTPVYVTNKKKIDVDAEVVYIERNELDYGGRLLAFLEHYYKEDDIILLVMADYLLSNRVNHQMILRAEELCRRPNIKHVRLRPMPRPQKPFREEGFGKIKKGSAYSVSLQPGIWKVETLKQLVQPGDNPWQIEVSRSRESHLIYGSFLSVEENVMSHKNYYMKGSARCIDWVAENVPQHAWPEAVWRKHGKRQTIE